MAFNIDKTVIHTFLPNYPFEKFITLQEKLVELRGGQKIPHVLIFATHHPCFSVGKERADSYKNFKVKTPLPIYPARRGGAVTYHGPGILGCYTIFKLNAFSPENYFELYQKTVRNFLSRWFIETRVLHPYPDLWIGKNKIVSIGIGYEKSGIVRFGFNINLSGDLKPFSYIYPCGIRDEEFGITSLEKELGHEIDTEFAVASLTNIMHSFLKDLIFIEIDPCMFFLK